MRIAFDAKRAFYNQSGLGNYSRNVIQFLTRQFPEHEYFLFTPDIKNALPIDSASENTIVKPQKALHKTFPSLWRSLSMTDDIEQNQIDLFHGLSNELPRNIHSTSAKAVVTIHDLVFMRFPELYPAADRKIYERKFRHACKKADKIIAISKQTKNDIIRYIGVDKEKIAVVYQGCNPIFYEKESAELKGNIRKKYNLPTEYILSVGTLEARKNTFTIVKTLHEHQLDIPLVLVGKPTPYTQQIKKFVEQNGMEKQVMLLHNVETEELPSIYQMSSAFVYPSLYEGFGIPILEALNSGIPVITSQKGCFSETGGPDSIYIDPLDTKAIAQAITTVLNDKEGVKERVEKGRQHALLFREEKIAHDLMEVYLSITQ